MSNENEVQDDYSYDEANAVRADDAASKITDNGPFVGAFTKAEATTSDRTGAHGIVLGFESPGIGNAEFTLWTKSADGVAFFGKAQLDAIMFLIGLKNVKGTPTIVERWVEGPKGREKQEVEGTQYLDLLKKPIGVVLQKELYTTGTGGTGERMNLVGLYQPETKLMMSEIKDRKTTPVKLDRLCRGLKTKDSRKAQAAEPSQPSIAGGAGDY